VGIDTEVTSKGILIIKLHGRMLLEDLHGLEGKFKKLIRDQRAVIVDLSGLEVLFSMGIRTLIMSAQMVEMRGGKLVLLAPTADVLAVLKASGTAKLIPICKDREEAESVVLNSATP
jgi:anti-anti-sigma factor